MRQYETKKINQKVQNIYTLWFINRYNYQTARPHDERQQVKLVLAPSIQVVPPKPEKDRNQTTYLDWLSNYELRLRECFQNSCMSF